MIIGMFIQNLYPLIEPLALPIVTEVKGLVITLATGYLDYKVVEKDNALGRV